MRTIRCCSLVFVLLSVASWPMFADKKSDATRTTVTFQEGLNGYEGTIDTEIWALAGNTILDGNINASSDANNDGGESQVLMRFERIIGTSNGQIPPNATIHSAHLIVSAFDEGNTVHLHRMLVPWKSSATWNSLVGGECGQSGSSEESRKLDLRQN